MRRIKKDKSAMKLTSIMRICAVCLAAVPFVLGGVRVSAAAPVVAQPPDQPSPTTGTEATQAPTGEPTQAPAGQTVSYDYIVTDYGVNAKDSKSDRDDIQAVLDMVKGASKQKTVYFPAGDYYISRVPLHVYSNTHIILDSKATIHRMDSMLDREIIHNTDQNGAMDVIGGYKMSHDITLEGGTWDGGTIAKAKSSADVIRFDHAENIIMKDCTVKNVYDCHLVEYVGVKNGSITGCTFSGFRYRKGKEKQFEFAREAIQLETAWTNNPKDKSDTDSLWANGSVVDGTTCQQVTVSNNTFIDLPCGVGQHHYTNNGKYHNRNITISDNTLTCSSKMKYCKTAITCGGMTDVTITRNKVTGPYRFGIHITQADNVTVSDNTISGSSQNGIMMDAGTAKAVTGNTVSNTAKHAISIGGGSLTTLSKNIISNSKQNGISIGKGKINSVSDNTITDIKKHGISVTGGVTINKMTGNTITKVNHDGITLDKGKIKLLSNNKITNVKVHGISITGGTVGVGKKRSMGIITNIIKNCKQNGISISKKGTVSAVHNNKIQGIKKNGISIVDKGVAYWITKNTIKKCKKHGIWNGSSRKKAKLKGNKGKTK